MGSRNAPRDQGDEIPENWTHVGIGAVNNVSTIDKTSVTKLKRKEGEFTKTDGSNTSLLGVGAINGTNLIKEHSFKNLTTISADGKQNDVIIERGKQNDVIKRKTSGSNTLVGIGAINGSNTIGKDSFDQLTTISTVGQGVVIKEPEEMDRLKEETKGSNKRFGIGEIGVDNTVKDSSFKKLEGIIPPEEKNETQAKSRKNDSNAHVGKP